MLLVIFRNLLMLDSYLLILPSSLPSVSETQMPPSCSSASYLRCCMICPMRAIFVPFIVVIIQVFFAGIPLRYLICLLLAFLDSKDMLDFLLLSDKCARSIDSSLFRCFAKNQRNFLNIVDYVKQTEALEEEGGFLSGIFNQGRQRDDQQNNSQPEEHDRQA